MAKDIAEKTKERMKVLAQFNESTRLKVEDVRGHMFNNLLDESLLSDDNDNNDGLEDDGDCEDDFESKHQVN